MKSVIISGSEIRIEPGKIVCVGKNYAEHAKELGSEIPEKPLIFIKPASVLINSGESVLHPSYSRNLHYEAELVLYIGKKVKNAGQSEAIQAIEGFGVGLDMTLRDLQNEFKQKGHPWTLSKVFDTSAVLSEIIIRPYSDTLLDETIKLKVNGLERQNSKLRKMIFKPPALVSYISEFMTLEKGDLIFTGTPEGVGRVEKGDIIEAEISGIINLKTAII